MSNNLVFLWMFRRERLRQLIESQHVRREDVADKAGITVQTLYNYENGKREPSIDNLVRIAKALKTTVAYFVGETDNPTAVTMKPSIIDMEEFKELPTSVVDKIFATPYRASIDPELGSGMTEEEITSALEETERRIYLYELRDALKKLKAEKQKG